MPGDPGALHTPIVSRCPIAACDSQVPIVISGRGHEDRMRAAQNRPDSSFDHGLLTEAEWFQTLIGESATESVRAAAAGAILDKLATSTVDNARNCVDVLCGVLDRPVDLWGGIVYMNFSVLSRSGFVQLERSIRKQNQTQLGHHP